MADLRLQLTFLKPSLRYDIVVLVRGVCEHPGVIFFGGTISRRVVAWGVIKAIGLHHHRGEIRPGNGPGVWDAETSSPTSAPYSGCAQCCPSRFVQDGGGLYLGDARSRRVYLRAHD